MTAAVLNRWKPSIGPSRKANNWRYLAYELVEFQEAIGRIDPLSSWVAE
jgi:hypothetical protein